MGHPRVGGGVAGAVADTLLDTDETDRTNSRRTDHDGIGVKPLSSLGLDGDGYGFGGGGGNLGRDGFREIAGEDGFARPVEVPAIVDGDDGVGAGGEALEVEAAVEVALVAEEGADVG